MERIPRPGGKFWRSLEFCLHDPCWGWRQLFKDSQDFRGNEMDQILGGKMGAKQPCRALTRLFLVVVVMWSGNGAQCWCFVGSVGGAESCDGEWSVVFQPWSFLKPYCPPGEAPKKPLGLLPGAGEPVDPRESCRQGAVLGKTKNTPQKTCKWASRAFCDAPRFGEEKRGLKNCEALRAPQWELDTALSFRINTKLSWNGVNELVQSNPFFCCCYTEFNQPFPMVCNSSWPAQLPPKEGDKALARLVVACGGQAFHSRGWHFIFEVLKALFTRAKVKMNSSLKLSSVCSQHFVSFEKRQKQKQISLPFWLFPTKKKKTFLITIISF